MLFFGQTLNSTHVRALSKNLYYSKRDVSTMVDMTSSRFFGMWVNCYIITIQLIEFPKIKPRK